MEITIGKEHTVSVTVTEQLLAKNVGSGTVEVYATPMMIALMEKASAECVQQFLTDEQTTVGTKINISHIAATPLGMKVEATATIIEVDKKKISFKIKAVDQVGIIGEGTHERFIVNQELFNQKAKNK